MTEAEKSTRMGSSEMPGLATSNMPANMELLASAQSTVAFYHTKHVAA
jgi:hypothetical protein